MRNIFKHLTKKAVLKGAAMGLGFVGVTGATAATTFFAVPQKITVKTLEGPATPAVQPLTGRQRFIGNLADSATNGLAITIEDLKFDQVSEGKSGHNTVEILPGVPATLNLELSELSLHGVQFSLTAPITYSNNGQTPKHRGIHASKVADDIYLYLFDNGNDDLVAKLDGTFEAPTTTNPTWDFKYKTSVASYDDVTVGPDSLTRGTVRYEYGDLDWLLADILEILSDGGISLSLEGWLNNLTGSSSDSSSASASSFNTDDILGSMDNMQEYEIVVDGKKVPYFVWDLPLGDLNLPLGFISDSSWGFKGVELPARLDENGNERAETSVSLGEGLSLSAHAKVEGGASIDFSNTVYGDPEEYFTLRNSAGLFEGVAKYVAAPQIGLGADFSIDHREEESAGTRTKLRKKAVSEEGILSLRANIDAYDGMDKKRALQGFDAAISLGRSGSDASNDIALSYLKEEEGFNAYLNVNDVMKATTTKTYLDSLYGQIVEDVFGTSADELTLDQLTTLLDKAKGSLDSVLKSDLVSKLLSSSSASIFNKDFVDSFKSGTYTGALDLITAIKNGDNTITLGFTTEPLGIPGDIEILLDGNSTTVTQQGEQEVVEVHNLLSVNIRGLELSSFTLNGSLYTTDFVAPSKAEDADTYESVSHLKGIASQIKTIANEKSFGASLSASIVKNGTETLRIENGELAFDFNKEDGEQPKYAEGSAKLRLVTESEKSIGTHDIALSLTNNFKDIAFHYDSHAETDEGGINGAISLPAFKKVFLGDDENETLLAGSLLSFFKEDDRFGRLASALMGEASSSLLSQVANGEYLALLENHGILSSFHLGDDSTTLSINGGAIGMENTAINLAVNYDPATVTEESVLEGGISSLSVDIVKTGEESSTIHFELSDIAPLGDRQVAKITGELENFNPLANLGAHLMNTLTLGSYLDGKVAGSSSYGIHGSIDLDIAGYGTTLYAFDAEAFVEGAETKIHAELNDFPVIRGVNGPDNEHYFRPNELEGKRNTEIFFYANGVNPEGEALIMRDSSYGKLRNVQDAVRLSGSNLTGDLLGWLGKYALGLDESLFAASESAEEPVPYTGEKDDGIHIDDAWKGFTFENGVYSFRLDLGSLVGISLLEDVVLNLKTKSVRNSENAAPYTIISGIEATLGAGLKAANTGNRMSIASAKVSIDLVNFYGENNVLDPLCGISSRFGQVFVKTSAELGDDGLIATNPATWGALYAPKGGTTGAFYADSYGDGAFDNYYCYDFTTGSYKGSNLYLLPQNA